MRVVSIETFPVAGGGGGEEPKDNFSGLNFREEKKEEKGHKAYKHPDAAISSAERWAELSCFLLERYQSELQNMGTL